MKKYEGLKLAFYFALLSILSFLLFKEIIISSFLFLLASLSLFISSFDGKISKEKIRVTENVFELTKNPEKLLVYMMILFFLILLNSPRIRIFVAATPFVYTPETFSPTYVKISTFVLCDKVVIRANVSDSENNQEATWMNLTDASNNLVYTNEQMTNTTLSCGTYCWIWEINYTLKSTDPSGTWIINVTANDTLGNLGSNSTTFSVEVAPAGCNCLIRFLPYTITESNKVYCMNESLYYNGTAIEFSSGVQNTTLDCQGNNLDSGGAGDAVYLTGSATKNNTIKNCNMTDFDSGVHLYYGPSNNTVSNNTIDCDYGVVLNGAEYNTLVNNTVNGGFYGILIVSGADYNEIINNTLTNNDDGIHFLTVGADNIFNHFENNMIKNNGRGVFLYDTAVNTTFVENMITNNDY
jgi:parallel beta-helix repeat protein